MYKASPRGVCSRMITFDIVDGKVTDVCFYGGCPGNAQGIAALAEGRTPEEVIAALEGICCGRKPTSCPDQLAQALKEAIANN